MEKMNVSIKKYNFYKKDYAKYLLLIKRKDKLIAYHIDAKIIAFLFKITFYEELCLSKNLLADLLNLKEEYCFNIAVVTRNKVQEYYCHSCNDYLWLKNKSKRYVKESEAIVNGEK